MLFNFIIILFLYNHLSILCLNIQGPLLNSQKDILSSNAPNSYSFDSTNDSYDSDLECELAHLPTKYPFSIEMNKYASHIPKGQCTEWADGRYYQLTGNHALFNGDAYKWNELASNNQDWKVSKIPKVPSIMVTEKYTNGAGEFGHVSIVESIIDQNTVCTSNWNFPQRGKLTLKKVRIIPSTSFIYHR